MSGGGINVEENLNRLDEIHIAAHLLHKDHPCSHSAWHTCQCFYLFEYDNPLISTFVERWHPKIHTFHLLWGECTITLEDVAMQLGLPIDSKPVSAGHVGTTKFNIKLKRLRTRLQQIPLDLQDNALI
ncbi:hypothetical protein Ahy_B05g074842 [Arachis hypogaea]|uniref:Aminotransferase-like plant mobile domain-containing protein n=1 Tax=Arachis hypogaea TaxID=3818 RepID=A0A444YZW5_ARAHY|nr:hypothetical protein Ahy_B05g074842 [Arachis hypogaea]